jgi:hypothetical protein
MLWKNTTPLLNDTISSLGKIKLVLSFHDNNSASEITLSIVMKRLRTLKEATIQQKFKSSMFEISGSTSVMKIDIRNTNPFTM